MFSFKSFKKSLASTFGAGPAKVDMEAARRLCLAAVADVPSVAKRELVFKLDHLKRASDWPELRCEVFEVLCRSHAESVARARLATIDDAL